MSAAYARKLSPKLSAAIAAKFIYSNLASGFQVGGVDITSGRAFAADISITYHSNPDLQGVGNDFAFGASISNLGSKISYTNSSAREFIPANLRIGTAYKMNLDEFNTLTFALDFNKLLFPHLILLIIRNTIKMVITLRTTDRNPLLAVSLDHLETHPAVFLKNYRSLRFPSVRNTGMTDNLLFGPDISMSIP